MIGNDETALKIYNETEKSFHNSGYRYIGFVSTAANNNTRFNNHIPELGHIGQLEKVIDANNVKQVVIALEKSEQSNMEKIIEKLSEKNVEIKILPNTLDILSGSVKTSNVFGAVLIDLKTGLMPDWQQNIKQVLGYNDSCCFSYHSFTAASVCCYQGWSFIKRPYYFQTGTNWVQRQAIYDV